MGFEVGDVLDCRECEFWRLCDRTKGLVSLDSLEEEFFRDICQEYLNSDEIFYWIESLALERGIELWMLYD